MNKRLEELLEREKLTLEELEEVEQDTEVESLAFCGASGNHIGYNWYVATTVKGKEYSVYCRTE